MVISSAFQSFDLCKELLFLFLLILSMFASFSTASNNFFKVVSAISAADKSFSFKSGNSPILLRTKFPVTFSLVNESRTSSSELGRLCLSSSNCSHSSLSFSVLCTYVWNSAVVHDLLSLLQLFCLYLGIQEQLPNHP